MEPTLSTFVNVQRTKVHCGQLILRIISKFDATSIGADTMGHRGARVPPLLICRGHGGAQITDMKRK